MPENTQQSPPYVRLSAFYFWYFASVGALVPFWSLYLHHLGFSALEIGELNAALIITKVVAPNIWGWLADRYHKHLALAQLGSLLGAVIAVALLYATGYWQLMLVSIVMGFFWNAVLSQFEVVSLNHLKNDYGRYGWVRLWGSVGFIITVIALGKAVDNIGFDVLLGFVLISFAAIAAVTLVTPNIEDRLSHDKIPLRQVLKQKPVIALIVVCFLVQVSHGPYYTFFSLFLEQHQYTKAQAGWFWALGVIAEIAVFMAMTWLLKHFTMRNLMAFAALVTGVRWLLLPVIVDSWALLVLLQISHLATFGIYHAVAIQLFHQYFRGGLQGQGQALYSSVSFGAGGAVGAWLAGWAWQEWSADITFYLAGVTGFVAVVVCYLGFEKR